MIRISRKDKIEMLDRHHAGRDLKLRKRQTSTTDNRKSVQLISKLGKKIK